MRWILNTLGFEGDLEGGLRSLRLAAEKGIYTRAEAKLYLSQFLFSEGRQDTAMRYLGELRTEYPENTLFLVLYAFWQHRMSNYDEALRAAHRAIEINEGKKLHVGEDLAYSTLGSIYFTLNDFANAAKYYRRYLQMPRHSERTPNLTFLRAGLACEIAGDRATAVECYRQMKEPDDQNRAWDGYNYRKGQELLLRPVSVAEILIVKAGNASFQKNHTQAITVFRDALHSAGRDVNLQARALYGLQEAQVDADSLLPSVETSKRLLALRPTRELWVLPHSWFKLGQAYARLGRAAEAEAAFERVEEYDDYDFQDRLERRVERETEKIKAASK
jgi:tetratricopeptide (TPR) repeat protein